MIYFIVYLALGLVIAFVINNTWHTFVNVRELAVTVLLYPFIVMATALAIIGILLLTPLTYLCEDMKTEEERQESKAHKIMRIFFPAQACEVEVTEEEDKNSKFKSRASRILHIFFQ